MWANKFNLSDEALIEARKTQSCPKCKKYMKKLEASQADKSKSEFYCAPCHLSIPLFKI